MEHVLSILLFFFAKNSHCWHWCFYMCRKIIIALLMCSVHTKEENLVRRPTKAWDCIILLATEWSASWYLWEIHTETENKQWELYIFMSLIPTTTTTKVVHCCNNLRNCLILLSLDTLWYYTLDLAYYHEILKPG